MPSKSPWTPASLCVPGALLCALMCAHCETTCAQTVRWQDERCDYRRTVDLPADGEPTIVVADFFAHGALHASGTNLTVYAGRDAIPFRVLQVGPGDYCRVAFQAQDGVTQYQIYYGGRNRSHRPAANPNESWLRSDGLLLETRTWRQCDLASLQSVRAAWNSADRIGSDYVSRVFHRHNPFMSRGSQGWRRKARER